MAGELLGHRQVGPLIEEIADVAPPEVVRAERLDTRLGGPCPEHVVDGLPRQRAGMSVQPAAPPRPDEQRRVLRNYLT